MKSIMQYDLSVSFLSGKGGTLEKHHIMNGQPYRKYAERYGLWIKITPEEHRMIHDTAEGAALQKRLKARAQKAFEAKYSRSLWLSFFRKNYIDMEDEDAEQNTKRIGVHE